MKNGYIFWIAVKWLSFSVNYKTRDVMMIEAKMREVVTSNDGWRKQLDKRGNM
ncbi:hypothetical protein D3C77_623650 [compost metagenome]